MADKIELSKFSEFLKNKTSNIYDNLAKAIELCGKKVSDDIKYSMDHTEVNTEISYYTNNKTKPHHPSLPGNPPAVDTGNLKNSIRYEVYKNGKEVYGIVGSTQKDPDYGVYLEYGTSDGRIAPRPWLRPAMKKNNEFIRKAVSGAVKITFKGVGK